MKWVSYGLSDVGKKRDKNEDSLVVNEELGLFVVADGMGGHLGGEYASQLAVKTIQEVLAHLKKDPEGTTPWGKPPRPEPAEQLKFSVRIASQKIFREANRIPSLRGMGTTVVALLVRDQKGYFANVGDSRAYLIRSSGIKQLTVDHSLVTEQLQAGFITPEEVKNHRLKNIITRSVGFQDEVDTDLVVRDLEEEDRFLLCSDGLTNMISDEEILRQVGKSKAFHPKTACEKLVELANRKGGEDNVSVILVGIQETADD